MEKWINNYTMSKLKAFLKGFVSAFDITGRTFAFPDYSRGVEHDREALAKDWNKVGNDLRKAMGIVIQNP